MKTFSRLSLFTVICLGFAVMLLGSTADVHAQHTLSVTGNNQQYDEGETINISFAAAIDQERKSGVQLTITSSTNVNVTSISNSGITGPLGSVTVEAVGTPGEGFIQARWVSEDGVTAKGGLAEFTIIPREGKSPALIVVNSPDPKDSLKVGDTFTQKITIENRGPEFSTLPLSAWQMDVVFNSSILEVVSVTEGDFLESDGEDAVYAAMTSPGKISVSQARAGQMANATPPPANVAKAPSPGGIALAAGDKGTLLTVEFKVLAFAEEALGIHNVQLQSCYTDKDGNKRNDRISYSILVSDVFVATAHKTYSYEDVDVNQDEMVDILDLMVVAKSLGSASVNSRADVNGDGFINVLDLVTIYKSDLWAGPAPATEKGSWTRDDNEPALTAPSVKRNVGPATIQSWIDLARIEDDGSAVFDLGIANLEALLVSRIPTKTRLLLNYPNPFNPETWIPYQLAEATDVTVTIHSMNGALVRTIELGHQSAGTYKSKSQAAYWDGRNEFGEQVASGLYFYTLTAGDYSATAKMLVRK